MNILISAIKFLPILFLFVVLVILMLWDIKNRAKLAIALNAESIFLRRGLKGHYDGKIFEVVSPPYLYFANYIITLFKGFPFEAAIYKKGFLNNLYNYRYGRNDFAKVQANILSEGIIYTNDVAKVESFFQSTNNKEIINVLFAMNFRIILIDKQKIVIQNNEYPFTCLGVAVWDWIGLENDIKKALKYLNMIG